MHPGAAGSTPSPRLGERFMTKGLYIFTANGLMCLPSPLYQLAKISMFQHSCFKFTYLLSKHPVLVCCEVQTLQSRQPVLSFLQSLNSKFCEADTQASDFIKIINRVLQQEDQLELGTSREE